ncbi:hypothetical protein LAZ67_10001223 [Cordylochernes scorpioides]|uniref:Retrovirus-related Pol polyprotein from transposon TNT 1-94-like beta-barrel domain-containing protein n=1 Tax=Cordylochernes scorpioides TaxID=51811 RepID=A0ABY6KZF7_9ARAC|nr:hypothetical protein LAZ67_10001223 [Cordylochernes scorpioides]
MQDFIKDTMEIVEKLTDLGKEIKDNHKVAILLCGLPEEYESLITALEARPEITLNYSKGKLIDESTFNQGYCEQAMKSVNKKRQTIIGRYCSKPGHIKKECFKFKADQHYTSNGWCIDSGASMHMTGDKSCFNKIYQNREDKIFLPDGKSMNAELEKATSLSPNVLYVPGMKENLLSVNRLTQLDFEVNFKRNVCEIKRNGELCGLMEKITDLWIEDLPYSYHLPVILEMNTGNYIPDLTKVREHSIINMIWTEEKDYC